MKKKIIVSFLTLIGIGSSLSQTQNCNKSLKVDGVNDYGLIKNTFFKNTNQRNFTIEFWLKPEGNNNLAAVWSKHTYWQEIAVHLTSSQNKITFFYATKTGPGASG
jgi:hypothetical protein